MKNRLLFSFFLLGLTAFSQKNETLNNWIQKNQDVIFIESNNLENFSETEMKKLGNKYIVFNNEINETDLLNYELKNGIPQSTLENEIVEVKEEKNNPKNILNEWLAQHSDLKIVTFSEFSSADSNAKEEYISKKCLILSGETLTIEDINNYIY